MLPIRVHVLFIIKIFIILVTTVVNCFITCMLYIYKLIKFLQNIIKNYQKYTLADNSFCIGSLRSGGWACLWIPGTNWSLFCITVARHLSFFDLTLHTQLVLSLLILFTPKEYPLLLTSSLPLLLLPASKTLYVTDWSGKMSSESSRSTLMELKL